MAIIEAPDSSGPLALPSGGTVTAHQALGVFARPGQPKGWRSWITSVDHKRVGVLYGGTALLFFVIGGIEALLIRLQLVHADGKILNAVYSSGPLGRLVAEDVIGMVAYLKSKA